MDPSYKDRTAERDFGRRYPVAAEFFKDEAAIEEFEHFIRTSVAQTSPAVGIDMIHHQAYTALIIDGDISSLWDKTADELMVPFSGTFLMGSVWITVKDLCPRLSIFIFFNGGRIGKFAAIVSQKQREYFFEVIGSEFFIKTVEDIGD